MPSFGQRSRRALASCRHELVVLAEEALMVGMDFAVIEGHRDAERQADLYHRGLSKLQWPMSKHNREPSEAFDVAPWPIDWRDVQRFYHLAGILRAVASESGLAIRWGGDWDCDFDLRDQSFMDLAHFELILPGR
jgi:peptidoglycan L-alanyl-D-glutamate endopeptidase CwlK